MAEQVLVATTTTSAPEGVTRTVETTPGPPPVKPGWKTTEFWLKVAAIVLSAMFASGAITNNTVLAVAGIAAAILGSLGYAVSRGMVKAAASTAPLVPPPTPPTPPISRTLP